MPWTGCRREAFRFRSGPLLRFRSSGRGYRERSSGLWSFSGPVLPREDAGGDRWHRMRTAAKTAPKTAEKAPPAYFPGFYAPGGFWPVFGPSRPILDRFPVRVYARNAWPHRAAVRVQSYWMRCNIIYFSGGVESALQVAPGRGSILRGRGSTRPAPPGGRPGPVRRFPGSLKTKTVPGRDAVSERERPARRTPAAGQSAMMRDARSGPAAGPRESLVSERKSLFFLFPFYGRGNLFPRPLKGGKAPKKRRKEQ